MGTAQTRASLKYAKEHFEKLTLTLKPEISQKFKENAKPSQSKFFEKILIYFLENEKNISEKNEKIDILAKQPEEKNNYEYEYDVLRNRIMREMEQSNNKIVVIASILSIIAGFVLGKTIPLP